MYILVVDMGCMDLLFSEVINFSESTDISNPGWSLMSASSSVDEI